MKQEKIEIMFGRCSKEEREVLIKKIIEDVEKDGGRVVAGEPIEKITVTVIGTRLTIEK